MQVKKNTLLLLACLVWTAAGVNILRIGLLAYATQVSLPHILLSLLVFFLFQVFVFGRLVGKTHQTDPGILGGQTVLPPLF